MDIRENSQVAVVLDRNVSSYPVGGGEFHPSERFPEYSGELSPTPNPVYGMVRQVLANLGLDKARFGGSDWNPIGALVPSGAKIVVKPNWVLHQNLGEGGTDCLVTHASVLRAALDYVSLAKPREVVVGDAPIQGCQFDTLLQLGARTVLDYEAARGMPLRLADFRRTTQAVKGQAFIVREAVRPADEYIVVDLGVKSLLEPLSVDSRKFRVTQYDPRRMLENQQPGTHRYLIAKDVLDADLVLNLPKLKTHKKAGITAALKNLVGINGNKDYLPHHRKGSAASGGDCYRERSLLKGCAEQVLDFANRHLDRPRFYGLCNRLVYYLLVANMRLGGDGDIEGGWSGNDTVWRMCLDLNRIMTYSDREGHFCDAPCRKTLSLLDGIVGGQGEGPLKPEPVAMGALLGAVNSPALDWIAAILMGFSPERIPIVANAFALPEYPLALFSPDRIRCTVNGTIVSQAELKERWSGSFVPSAGWKAWLLQKTR